MNNLPTDQTTVDLRRCIDADAAPVGLILTGWFAAIGRHDDAVRCAYAFGLIDAEHLEAAWDTGADPLALAGLLR
jgi:hypothetical protein